MRKKSETKGQRQRDLREPTMARAEGLLRTFLVVKNMKAEINLFRTERGREGGKSTILRASQSSVKHCVQSAVPVRLTGRL